jgi:UDP-N-acetylglucosamine 2-epimerase (non-hydrolysing)
VTLRNNTERPETLDVGSNVLAGTAPNTILKAAKSSLAEKKSWINPFGDGKAGQNIVNLLRTDLAKK